MRAASEIQSALSVAQSAPVKTPHMMANAEAARKAAGEFEGVLISQMMGSMFEGISTDGPFGGGQGEQMFRSVMLDEYGKQVAKRGGLGLADSITRSLLSHQEAKTNPVQNPVQANPVVPAPGDAKTDVESDVAKTDAAAAESVKAAAVKPNFIALDANKMIFAKTALPRIVEAAR